jgi:hypothetical protein
MSFKAPENSIVGFCFFLQVGIFLAHRKNAGKDASATGSRRSERADMGRSGAALLHNLR